MKKIGGFTLIELLVVIAIIGLISSMSLIVLRGKVSAARDAKRRADIATLQTALALYEADHQRFPGTGGCVIIDGHWGCSVDQVAWFVPNLAEYMTPSPPQDPGHHKISSWNTYGYIPLPVMNHAYALFFMLEGGPQEDYCNIGPISLVEGDPPVVWSTRCPD